jgi:hypothetical protein
LLIILSSNLQAIFEQFDTGHDDEAFLSAEAYGSGHINDTFRVQTNAGREQRYCILQRINTSVFGRPVELMDNIRHITDHLSMKSADRGGDPSRETLTLLPTKDTGSGRC